MRSLVSLDLPSVLTRLGIDHRRRGKELFAVCPFHEERTPSWSIRADGGDHHGLWRCKGACPEPDDRGSVVTLVARLLGFRREDGSLDRSEARRWLFGAEAEDRPAGDAPLAVELDVAFDAQREFCFPAGVVVRPAAEWSSLPLRYLTEVRGVSAEQIDRWALGYALGGRLAGRVVMPARDAVGRLRSYSARTFIGDRLKWRSADAADGADRDAVFGEAHWPATGREVVLVEEAALDALAVEAATGGRACVAALHGSEPSDSQLEKLATFKRVVVATDPDDAGWKIYAVVCASLSRWTRVTRAELPVGFDASRLWRDDPGVLTRVLGV